MELRNYISDYPNFPKDGILFRDISPLLRNPEAWQHALRQLGSLCERLNTDCIAGIESRGFIVGTALASAQRMGFIPIRKKGKLPGDVIGVNYSLEYGEDRLEMQSDTFTKGTRVLLVDDLLATGGTAQAAARLVEKLDACVIGFAFIIELTELKGIEKIKEYRTEVLVQY